VPALSSFLVFVTLSCRYMRSPLLLLLLPPAPPSLGLSGFRMRLPPFLAGEGGGATVSLGPEELLLPVDDSAYLQLSSAVGDCSAAAAAATSALCPFCRLAAAVRRCCCV
jgi:hypothetical protein